MPVGTGDEVERILREERARRRRSRSSPTPNSCARARRSSDFKRPDRIVIGTEDERAREVMREVYRPLYLNEAPILFTGRRTSELIKYAANAFLATKITFINEIADLCEAVGADVQDVSRGIGLDNRIGAEIPPRRPRLWRVVLPQGHAGAAQDRRGLSRRRCGSSRRWWRSTTAASARWAARSSRRSAATPRGKTVALLGLTFKPNTDDMRDAPTLAIVQALQDAGATVRAYDPEGMEQARPMMPDVTFCDGRL